MASGVSASMALTLAGFCFSVIFIVFVCSRLACALLLRCSRSRRRSPALPQYAFAVHVAGGAGAGGLNPAAVAAFPTRAFAASDSSDAQCVVCLAEYEEKDVLRLLPYCGHNFHMACIDMWLELNSTCPVCRISLRDNPDSKHTVPLPLPSAVISPTCSPPQASRSDPCHCLFVSTGHSSRASEVLRHEPDQENQIASGPSVDGANNLPLSEVNSPRENNSQTVRNLVERSTQLGPCK
ncbi:RING-H2 finger protein ATL67-like [Phragmites australis]|uniref:RING-H2 finger protein ATL67-like n=1 Tax=Phragmites australis TaxID=29695 RepID=UPI002D78EB83|nr:RING-H2 finger protein ATL67-like [Phragmites australis]